MKQITVGTYKMGYEKIELVIREGLGGEFYFLPGDINYPRIKIGADQDDFWRIIDVLIHELSEFASARLGCRYNPEDTVGKDHHAYTFIMSNAMIADFICRAWSDIEKAWKLWKIVK